MQKEDLFLKRLETFMLFLRKLINNDAFEIEKLKADLMGQNIDNKLKESSKIHINLYQAFIYTCTVHFYSKRLIKGNSPQLFAIVGRFVNFHFANYILPTNVSPTNVWST